MFVCMHECMHACMHTCMYVWMYVCPCVSMYVYECLCVSINIYIYNIYINDYTYIYIHMYVPVYVYLYIYMCVCMYLCEWLYFVLYCDLPLTSCRTRDMMGKLGWASPTCHHPRSWCHSVQVCKIHSTSCSVCAWQWIQGSTKINKVSTSDWVSL